MQWLLHYIGTEFAGGRTIYDGETQARLEEGSCRLNVHFIPFLILLVS